MKHVVTIFKETSDTIGAVYAVWTLLLLIAFISFRERGNEGAARFFELPALSFGVTSALVLALPVIVPAFTAGALWAVAGGGVAILLLAVLVSNRR